MAGATLESVGGAGGLAAAALGPVTASCTGAGSGRRHLIADAGRVNRSIGSDRHRRDFALRRLIQHETLACRSDAQDQAAGVGADDQVAVRVDGQRARVGFFGLEKHAARAGWRHAMDLALIAGGDEQVAGAGKCQRPDVFRLGS